MSIQWNEINSATPMYSIAGRSDELPVNRGEAAGAVVVFLSNTAMSRSINSRIRQALGRSDHRARQMLPDACPEGVLAVAEIELARFGELDGQRFNWCRIVGFPFQTPRQAVRWYEHQPSISAMNSYNGSITNRYFWGTTRSVGR